MLALHTLRLNQSKNDHDRAEARSKALLDVAKAGLDEAVELLKDQNNTRDVWVRAARALLDAKAAGREIVSPAISQTYRMYEDKTRNVLYRALSIYDGETRQRHPLPPQFFFGMPDLNPRIEVAPVV